MEPSQYRAVAQLIFELFLEIAVELDPAPMDLTGARWVLQDWNDQIPHPLQSDFAGTSGTGARGEAIDARAIETSPCRSEARSD